MNNEEKKRQYEYEDSNDVKRRERIQQFEIQFDFDNNDNNNNTENEDISSLLEKLIPIKQQLNDVKSLLSDKDITDWNRLENINKEKNFILIY
jgi:hypothetical protein